MTDRDIYNRIIESDGSIKHINQQDVLDNIDAIHDAKIRDRIAVIFPDGDTGTIEAWELKNALKEGYQLVDDTEGYNNRPDIIEKRKAQQETIPQRQASAPIDVAKTLNRMDDSPYGRTIGKQQTESGIADIIAKDTRPMIEQAAAPAKEAAQVQVPRLPWQSDLEYAETVMAAQKRENERFQEQMMQEARHAVPESTQEIISSIDAIDSELEELTGEKAADKLAESYYTSPEHRILFQIGKKRPKELSAEQRQRVNELQEQKKALQVQYDLLNKFKKYEDFDKDADRNALGRFFGGMYAEGDMQALATFGLSRMQKDLEFIGILEKARNGRKLSSDEQKAIQLYQNLQEIQSKDRGAFFSAGTGMQTTFEFMRDMALFGFGGLAKTATNQGVKQIVKQSLKNYGKKTAEIFLKAPITPSFYKNLTANQIANYEIKEGPNGTWDINQKESSLKNLYRTYAETTTEFASEALGNVFENIGLVSRLAKSAGKGKGILSKAVKTYDRMHNKALHNKWGKFILNGMEQMGLNNMPSEFLEEIAVIPMQSLMLWENQFDQLADPRFYQEVAISTAALGGMHSAVNIAVGGPSALIERRKINKELDNTRSALVSIRDTQIGDTPEEVKIKFAIDDILADVDNRDYYNENYEFTAETIINHLDKLRSRAGSNSELIQQAENYVQLSLYKEGQTEAMRAIVEDEVGAFEYGTSGGVMLGTTNDGRQVFILDEAGKSVTVRMMEKDAQPEVISRDDIQNVQTYTMDAFCTDYFVGKRPGSTQIETIEDIQQMDQQAQQPAESIAIVAGETALYDGTPVEVIDTYDNNNMVTVRDANGQTHSVPAEDLQGVAPSQNKTIYISPTGERYIEIGQTPDRRYLIQRLDDNNMPIQDTLVATSEELMQYDKLDPQEADAIEEVAQQVTGTLENEPGAIEESTEDVLPVDKDGNIDYDTLLVQSPQRFLQEFSNVVGEEEAVQQLKSVVANVDQKIEQVTGKLNKATSLNESIKLQQEIAKLQSQRDSIQSILQSEENSAPVEETIPAEQEIISASEEISPDVEETMTVKEEINPISEEIGTETEEIGTVEIERDAVEPDPVTLSYLLKSGPGTVPSTGFFLHAVAVAFPELTQQIESIRSSMSSKLLDMDPTRFSLDAMDYWAQIRKLILHTYGTADIYDAMVDNSTGFVPSEGRKIESDLEQLEPLPWDDTNQPQNLTESVKTEPVKVKTILENALDNNANAALEQQGLQVNTEPTEGQKEAGNYKMGHVKINGFDITIENPKGSIRSGIDNNGVPWEVQMNNHYGYFRGTKGKDGDQIDVFVGDSPTSGKIFIVDQVDENGNFDEHKVMMGFDSIEEAQQAYMSNYSPGWNGLGNITEVSVEDFKEWAKDGRKKTQPFVSRQENASIIPQADEVDEYGNRFVLASDGSTDFGLIDAESGLKQAPIKLSMGDNTIDEKGNNHGYGLLHIEAERGDAIRKAGYSSVQEFVESVAKNYTDIREGGIIANNQTYLLELVDEHNNTLFIQLSKNGEYWTINSAGIFRKKYSRNKRKVYNRPALGSDTNTDISGVNSGQSDGVTTPAGNSPQTSANKGKQSVPKKQTTEQQESSEAPVQTVTKRNRLVDDEKYAQLKERMRKKLSQLNVGIDPEMLSIGIEMAVYHIENGAYKFADYTRKMVADLGDAIRPYLKAFYNGARDLPGMEEYAAQMNSYADVSPVNVNDINVEDTVEEVTVSKMENTSDNAVEGMVAQVESVPEEPAQSTVRGTVTKDVNTKTGADIWVVKLNDRVERDEYNEIAAVAKSNGGYYSRFKKGFIFTSESDANNFNNLNYGEITDTQAEQRSADTIAVISQAETVVSQISSQAEAIRTADDAVRAINECDRALASINEQLALLGYYQADYNPDKFNESYGYIKTAEQKALKDAEKLAKSLAKDLGIDIGRKKVAKANIAPAGGNITFRLPLNESKQLYVDISLMPNSGYYYDKKAGEDDLFVRGVMDYSGRDAIMYRVEDPNATGMNRYGVNNFANADATYQDLLSGIKRVAGEYLTSVPEQSEHEDVTIDKLVNPLRQSSNPDFNIGDKVLYNGEIATITDFDMGRPVLDTGFGPVMYELANWNDITKYEPQTITENGEETVQQLEGSAVTAERDGQPRVEDETVGSSQQPQVLTDEPAGVDTDSSATIGDDTTGDRGVSGHNVNEQSTVESGEKNTHNWRYPASGTGIPTSVSARLKANIAAIKVLRELQENNAQATPGQMEVLSRYSGWGGMGTYFNSNAARIPGSEAAQIKELLTDEEYSDAVMSLNSAYYTPVEVINTLWDVAQQLGFKGGNILEGSAGTGNILGFMPEGISSNSNIEAVEIDSISGSILSYLYPDAQVHVQGFEKTAIANNSVDLAITNVPFVTGLRVNDPIDKDLSRKFKNIHDFCIAKNVRKLREGGIGIFITSNGTLDKSKQLREWLVSREGNADVIGAFRLNNRTFEGAPVTSDIIVVRKRVGGIQSPAAIDVLSTSTTRVVPVKVDEKFNKKTGQYEDITRDVAVDYNTYFQQHPEYMGGEMAIAAEKGDTFRPASVGLYPSTNINQEERMKEWVSSFSPVEQSARVEIEQKPVYEQSSEKEGSLILDKQGRLCISRRGEAVPLDVNDNKIKGKYTKAEALKDYNALKQALNDVLQYQVENDSDEGLSPLLKKLNTVYDNFVKKYGPLNRNVTISFLRNDVDFTTVAAIEKYSESETNEGKKKIEVSKTDVFKGRVIGNTPTPTPTNVQDGIILSVQKNGYIDVDLISQWLGMDKENVLEEVISSRMGFINPANSLLEVRHEYLSGNVREKLAYARANNQDNAYTTNIEELEKVVPMDIPAHLIEFSLGSTWIDPKLYSAFVEEKYDVTIDYTNINGVWVADRDVYANNEKNRTAGVYSEMVGKRVMGHELFLAAMNNTPITVSKTVKHYNGTTETVTDKQASQMCTVRMQEIKEEFKDWARARMQADAELAEKMTRVYNDKFNAIVPKTIDDVFTPERFEGANKVIDLYPHQKKAVIRATTEPLMLAHEVGTGKTFTLITTAMEMRRLGTAKKPMIVVQNATVGQFVSQAKFLYPNAKVLTISDKDRTAEGRKEFYAKIKYNDWDLIVVPQSVFEMIPDNETRMRDFVQEKIDEKMYAIQAARDANLDNNFIRQLENELKQLEEDFATGTMQRSGKKNEKKEAVAAQNAQVRAEEQLQRSTDDVEDFDEMGIDALLVDEAHEYKHLGFATSMKRGVKGVDPSYSKKAASVYLKTRAVLEKSSGKNVVFATGTPISNTAAEIWTFMRYLMPKDTMVANDIYYFDDFVRNFGNITQNLEFATNGKFKENTRFASYVNLPELVRLWGSVSDTVLTKEVSYVNDKVPEMETGKAMDIFLPQSPGLVDIMRGVRQVLEEYDKMTGKEKKANSHIPLTMYGIAKRAAIDPRLVDSNAIDEPLSKTNRAVEETLRTLEETKSYKGTVAIFCDSYRRLEEDATGKKKETFNLFQEIKRKLVTAGVPASQIVIMESGMTVSKKEKVFADVNAGNVRVILGSTQTLGTGVNIQQSLHTLIHMDAPDRPMDYTQRNGRILRQGNLHKEWGKEVRVLRFGVEDSLDVTSYQRLKTKSSFIDSVMDSKPLLANNQENRTLEEEEEGLFDNPVAVLSGSQYALLKSQAERELRKWQGKYKQWEADQVYVNAQLKRNAAQLEKNAANMTAYEQNLAQVEEKFPQGTTSVVTIDGIRCTTEEERIQAFKEVNKKMNDQIEQLRNNPYGQRQQYTYTLDFDGMPVEVTLDLRRDSRYNEKIKGVQVSVHRDMKYNIPALGLTDVPVSGAYIKGAVDDILENVITGNDARERIAAITKGTKRLQEENKLLSARDGKPFEYTKELNDARDKVDEYTTAMKKELQEKEAKYADMGTGATVDVENIILDDDDDSAVQAQIVDMVDSVPELTYSEQMAYDAVRQALSNASIPVVMATDEMVEEVINVKEDPTEENNVQFEIVTDNAVLNQLESGPTMKVYRAMQLIDGELYPPMSAVVNGKLRKPIKLGVWEQAEENPELADNKGYFKLDKGNKKSLKARYNPYIHTSTTPLNDQFSEAQSRPNLVTVEVEIPVSELTSGYKAEKAKDPVGRIEWKAGVIQSKISGKREVILSRWDKPVRIVPDSEVAEKIVEMFDGRDITMPSNVVTPSLRNELEKRGINFVETDNRGKPIRFSIDSDAENVSEIAAIIENAKAAGTYLKAPNGKDTNLTPKQWAQVRTKAFKEWFGDWENDADNASKVVDENGEPLVVYHGSKSRISKFDISFFGKTDGGNSGIGFYFTPEERYAKTYGENVHPAFLNIKTPLLTKGDINIEGLLFNSTVEQLKERFSEQLREYKQEFSEKEFIEAKAQIDKLLKQITPDIISRVNNSDGVINKSKGKIFEIVVKNPNQIKSATENTGEFSAENDDIRFSIDSVKKSRVGTVRGWTKDGVVYLTKDGLNPETPIHEYTHIWADAVQKYNPALWNNIKSLLKRLPQWQQVVSDVNYQDIAGNEDAVASEVLARYSGKRGAKRLEQDAREFGQATGRKGYAAQLLQKVKKALEDFWNWVNVNLFNISGFSSAEEIADRVLYDLVSGTDLSRPATITQEILKQNTVEELLGNEAYGNMMGDVFSGIDVITQVNMVKGGDRQAQTRKYIADVCSDVANRGEEAMQIVASARKAFQDKGMMLDISDADLLHKMWQDNNSEPRQTLAESLTYENRSKKVQFSIEEDMGPTTNDIKLNWWERQKERWIDRMHSVAVLKKIVTTRHGTITADTDPYMSENLASARSMHEIDKFKKDIYEPLLEKVVEVQKLFVKLKLSNAKLAYKAVNDYLYAMHAPERNKRICVEEVVDKMMKKLSKEEQKFFKSANVRDVLIALVGRMYNERQNPKTPFTSDIFATNIVKGAAKTKEENDLLNEFRKKFTDLTKTARTDIDKIFKSKRGTNRSGMIDQEAKDILAKYVTPETKQILEDLSNIVRRSNDFTLKTWLKYSLIDQETYDGYKEMYKNYIPLRSWAEKEDVDYDSLGKQAFNHASEIINLNRKAYGRSSRADDPIAYIGSLAQSAVVVGNKNMVHLNAFRLVQQNKDILEDIAILPQIYYVEVEGSDEVIAYEERPPQEYFDKGMVTSKTNRSYRWHKTNSEYEAHTVAVIINGVRYMIVFKGNIGIKIASALNNTNVNHWAAADALRPLTRWLSAVRTSYSPEFVLVNFVRDFLFGNIAYAIEGGNVASLNKNLAAAFKAINKSALGKRGTSKIDRLYEEFQSEGGQTGFIHMRKLEQIKKENEVMRRKMAGQRNASDVIWRNWLMRMGKGSMEYLSVMSENAMRFAVYMTEREKGTSAKEAAYKAHEITVNFNRKGTYSGNMNAFYSFFNASVQGTYRLWQLGKQNPKRTAVALTSLALVKLLSAAIAAMVGGDDYDELSDYVKFSNIIIPTGTDDQGRTIFFTIPMPQGMRAFSNLSDVTVDVLRGNKTVWDAISTFTLNAVGEFVPLSVDAIDLTGRQSGQSIVAPFVPTAIQPFFDVWSNRDFKGDPIYKEDFTQGTADYTPAYKKVYGNANPVMVGISKWINNIAGGSDEMSSAIKFDREDGTVSRRWYGYAFDINPASAEHLINGYLGGMSTFVSNILKTANAVISEDVDLELYNLPVAGRFVRQAYYKEGYNTWYEVADMVKDIEAMERALQREKDWDGYRAFKQNTYNTQLVTMFNMYDDRVKQLRDITKSGNLSAQEVKKYNKEVDALISKASKEFEQIMERYEEN